MVVVGCVHQTLHVDGNKVLVWASSLDFSDTSRRHLTELFELVLPVIWHINGPIQSKDEGLVGGAVLEFQPLVYCVLYQ